MEKKTIETIELDDDLRKIGGLSYWGILLIIVFIVIGIYFLL